MTMPTRSRLNFQHLYYLEALVEERNVTRAADRVGISQPAMSTALSRLRVLLNDPLLVHTRRGMEPTPKAFELARHSRNIGPLLDGGRAHGEPVDLHECTKHWRVMASDGIARAILPPLMKVAGTEAPLMRFSVSPGDPRRMHEYLRDGDFDIVLAFVRNPAPDLRQVSVLPQRLVCIVRKGHPRIDGSITMKKFLAESHVRWGGPPIVHTTLEAMVDETLEKQGYARRITLLAASLYVLPDVVSSSDLVAVVPEKVAEVASSILPLQVLTLPFKIPMVEVSLTWHERQHNDPAHKWLRHAMINVGRSGPLAKQPPRGASARVADRGSKTIR